MGVLSGLEPKAVFEFFEDLCALPHGTHQTGPVSDYLVDFARRRGLRYRRDEVNNVVIWKDAAPGYEDAPTLMLQGHMDMLVDKEHSCARDTEKEGLEIFVAGDEIGAHGTTLGADDCIGVAMALAVLDDDHLRHGPLECVFTVDEEMGMQGVRALDVSDLKAKYMINLDSLEERVFTVSCAGSTRVVSTLPVQREPFDGRVCALMVDGLVGGHSGEDIHRGRANANRLMGRALTALMERTELRLLTVSGGAKDNTIPRDAAALIAVKDLEAAKAAAKELAATLENEYRAAENRIRVRLFPTRSHFMPMDEESTRRAAAFLFCAPNGVQMMSAEVPGLVQTSLNYAMVYTEDDRVVSRFMIRSSINSQAEDTARRVMALTRALGGEATVPSSYSAWQYRPDSHLREVMTDAFMTVYGMEPRIAAQHASLECGIFSGKIPELDCISIGPDVVNVHTPRERLRIASTWRTWAFLRETLRRLK
jgi:dipeptidase D